MSDTNNAHSSNNNGGMKVKITASKRSLYFATAILLFAGFLGACSSRAPQTNNDSTSQSNNTAAPVANVVTSEMKITFDSQPTRAGKITFVVKNEGKIEHSFALDGNGVDYHTKHLQPGETETITADLPPGQYEFVCSVFGHAIAGMRGSFTLR